MALTLNGFTALSTLPRATFVAPNGKTVYVRDDDVATVLGAVARRWHQEIEPLPPATFNEAPKERQGFIVIHGFRPPGATVGVGDRSNHRSATAIDINGHLHPFRCTPAKDGFTEAQRRQLRRIRDDIGVIRLGIDFAPENYDPMHVEIAPGMSAQELRTAAFRLRAGSAASAIGRVVPGGLEPKAVLAKRGGPGGAKLIKLIQERVQHFRPQPVDGVWGDATDEGVEGWQRALGVVPDHVVGRVTVRADLLFHIDRAGRSLRHGDTGIAVKFLQYMLNSDCDGTFDQRLVKRLKAAQLWAGIDRDGKLGPQSVEHLVR